MPLQKLNRLDVLSLQMVIDLRSRDEVGRLSTAFHRMIGALARSRADQRRLVEDAGHELRTPVTSIRTGLDTLSRYPDLPADERAEIVESMRAEASELTSLVNEVVQVASGEVDDSEPEQVRMATLLPPQPSDLSVVQGDRCSCSQMIPRSLFVGDNSSEQFLTC